MDEKESNLVQGTHVNLREARLPCDQIRKGAEQDELNVIRSGEKNVRINSEDKLSAFARERSECII